MNRFVFRHKQRSLLVVCLMTVDGVALAQTQAQDPLIAPAIEPATPLMSTATEDETVSKWFEFGDLDRARDALSPSSPVNLEYGFSRSLPYVYATPEATEPWISRAQVCHISRHAGLVMHPHERACPLVMADADENVPWVSDPSTASDRANVGAVLPAMTLQASPRHRPPS